PLWAERPQGRALQDHIPSSARKQPPIPSTLYTLNPENLSLCILCRVLACKYLYFKLKQGKDITTQVICVRGMKHARKGSAKRSEAPKRKRSAECPDPCVSKGHAQKEIIP
ncbi:MAG: hypothetical protein NZ519_07205, partial [Bacteroidia bacterium]|nr:hypothetical protein [Bacteroidia bacterium]